MRTNTQAKTSIKNERTRMTTGQCPLQPSLKTCIHNRTPDYGAPLGSPSLPARSAQTTLGCPRGPLGISARLFTCLLRYLSSIICCSFLRQCSLKQPHCVNFCSRKPRHATIQETTCEKKRTKCIKELGPMPSVGGPVGR